jgi:hypothetical protein
MSERSSEQKFSRRKEMAIGALLSHPTLTAAASASGVSARTLTRWLQDKAFSARVRRERAALLESTTDLLRKESVGAVAVLASVAKNQRAPCGSRVTAAKAIIELSFKAGELLQLTARVEELERQTELHRSASGGILRGRI